MDPLSILVPVDDQPDPAFLTLATDLLGAGKGIIILLAVVEMPLGRQPVSGAAAARAARHALRRLAGASEMSGVDVRLRVRAARSRAAGIREVADEERPDLLLLQAGADATVPAHLRPLVDAPPCDLVIVRLSAPHGPARSVLVPARGGPTAELALSVAVNLATRRGAQLTLLHLDTTGRAMSDRVREERLFRTLLAQSGYPRLRSSVLPVQDVLPALMAEAERHDMTVLGAGGSPNVEAGQVFGAVPDAVLAGGPGTVLVVKPRRPVDPAIFVAAPSPDAVVDKWFAENTFHCREFADVEDLVRLKQAQGLRLSIALMAAGEAETLPSFARVMRDELGRRAGLVDEVVVFDDGTVPDLAAAALQVDLPCVAMAAGERGRAVWESLRVLSGDLIVWLDTDLRNVHAKFVYGLVGPLLREQRISFVTGFSRLPETLDDAAFEDGHVQTTELAVRPLLNLYFPELSGLINPLARERAARREALTGLRLLSGAGSDIALLLDIYERGGLHGIAQSDVEERVGRPVQVAGVTRRAFATIQAMVGRVTAVAGMPARPPHTSMKLIRSEDSRYYLEIVETAERLLPPISGLPALSAGSLPSA